MYMVFHICKHTISTVISFYANKLHILLQYYFSDYCEKFSVLMKNKKGSHPESTDSMDIAFDTTGRYEGGIVMVGNIRKGLQSHEMASNPKKQRGPWREPWPPASDSNKNGYRVFSNQAIVLAVISLSWVSSPLKTPKVCPAPSTQEISASGLCTKAFWMVVAVSGTTDVSLVP